MFLIMFTFVYIYIDFNVQVAILDQYGNGLSLVALEWFQVSYLSVVVGRASSLWLVSYGGRTKAHVDCTPTG